MTSANVDLESLAAVEEENLGKTRLALGSLWSAATSAPLLYGRLSQALQDRDDARSREEFYGISVFLLAAQRAASVGTIMTGRLHLQESSYLTRRCLELVGFSYRSLKEPASLAKWLHAGKDAAAYEEYQDAFSSKKLRGDLHELGSFLLEVYDSSNKMIHSSLYSFAQAYEHAKMEKGAELRLHMFDAQADEHWPRVALELLRTMKTHLDATSSLAARLLRGAPGRTARTAWKEVHDPTMTSYRREIAAWRGRAFAYEGKLARRRLERRR